MNRFLLVLLALSLSSFVLLTDYGFINKPAPFHLEADYRQVASAKFSTKEVRGDHLRYADGEASAYYSYFLNKENALVGQLGYYYNKVDWQNNPFFTGSHYNYGIASLAWVSTALERWRWILAFSNSVDLHTFNWGQSGIYYGLMWGRYAVRHNIGIHVGWYGWVGVENDYLFPVLGIDYQPTPRWQINAIFPIDASITYFFGHNWGLRAAYANFGRPYRMPHRMHGGKGAYHDGIFAINSSGVELDLRYNWSDHLFLLIGGGYNTGGWIQVQNRKGNHKHYDNFDGAPYGVARITGSF